MSDRNQLAAAHAHAAAHAAATLRDAQAAQIAATALHGKDEWLEAAWAAEDALAAHWVACEKRDLLAKELAEIEDLATAMIRERVLDTGDNHE